MQWKKELVGKLTDADRRIWRISIWYWDKLSCELNNQDYGTPYINVVKSDESVIISLSNRDCDKEKLEELNFPELRGREGNDNVIVLEKNPESIAESVSKWIKKIDDCIKK